MRSTRSPECSTQETNRSPPTTLAAFFDLVRLARLVSFGAPIRLPFDDLAPPGVRRAAAFPARNASFFAAELVRGARRVSCLAAFSRNFAHEFAVHRRKPTRALRPALSGLDRVRRPIRGELILGSVRSGRLRVIRICARVGVARGVGLSAHDFRAHDDHPFLNFFVLGFHC